MLLPNLQRANLGRSALNEVEIGFAVGANGSRRILISAKSDPQ